MGLSWGLLKEHRPFLYAPKQHHEVKSSLSSSDGDGRTSDANETGRGFPSALTSLTLNWTGGPANSRWAWSLRVPCKTFHKKG